MNKPLKLIKVGNSTGVILPKEMLMALGVEAGDMLAPVSIPGGVALSRHDYGFAEQMKVAREVMARRRDALAELAK